MVAATALLLLSHSLLQPPHVGWSQHQRAALADSRTSLPRCAVPAAAAGVLRAAPLRARRGVVVATAEEQSTSLLGRVWPNTLCKFWGLHTAAWGAAAAVVAVLLRSALPLPLLGANAVLMVLLYRSREDFGTALAALAGTYFVSHAAMLWLAAPVALGALLARGGMAASLAAVASAPATLRALRLWHTALALGGFAFSVKAALKDRLFDNQDGSMRQYGESHDDGAPFLPTLCLINRKAGAKLGERIGAALDVAADEARAVGGVLQVVDLSATPPVDALTAFHASHPIFRVLVCGGDGSASWVLSAIEECDLRGWDGGVYRPAVALLPLGTGNDLARVLGWGKGVRFEALRSRLVALDGARVALLDRWRISGTIPENRTEVVMSNYLSIGVDAKAALLWARMALRVPALFRLRLLNKLWYIICGTPEFWQHSYRRLDERLILECDGEVVALPRGIEGLMVLNTPSYGGGSDLWDESRGAPLAARTDRFTNPPAAVSSMSDGLLEVVGVTDVVHLAFSLGGLSNGVRLCQGRRVRVRSVGAGVPLQIDGEPCNIDRVGDDGSEPFDLSIAKCDTALLLARGAPTRDGAVSAYGAIESQLSEQALSTAQRDALLAVLGR